MSAGLLEGNIVDLHAGRVFPGRLEWDKGRITHITALPGRRFSRQLCPGFVDAHIHIESSLLPPSEFARRAVIHGTVGTVSDPHEIANVLGVAGVEFMLRDAARSPFKFHFGAPSCVPATRFETAGAHLDSQAVSELLARPDIHFLSEVMNFPGVLAKDPELLAMIARANSLGKPVDGHAPGLRGARMRAYAAAGISTDHECFTRSEALGKLRAGMRILIREGSAARNFAALEPLLQSHPEHCMLCSDDLHPDLLMLRHIDGLVRRALKGGADRLAVLRAACLNPVTHYKLGVGLLRPGDPADFIVFKGWKTLKVTHTYLEGELVARGGRSFLPRLRSDAPNHFLARPIKPQALALPATGRKTLPVIGALNGQLMTKHLASVIGGKEARLLADVRRDLLKIAVVNRYAPDTPPACAFIHGFGLKHGAIASSVAHDSHNIVAVGADDVSLCRAINAVIRHQGGLSVVTPGSVDVLPLPIAGLMSDRPADWVAARYTQLDRLAKALGSSLDAPFMTLSFMALLVIPELKLSDKGLFSAKRWRLLE